MKLENLKKSTNLLIELEFSYWFSDRHSVFSDVIDVIINYGKPLTGSFQLEIVSCFLVSSTHGFALINGGTINQVSDESE